MSAERIDALMKNGLSVLDGEINMRAVYLWKKEALELLVDHLGPDHYYTQCFSDWIRETEQKNVLIGNGILSAAKEEIFQKGQWVNP